MLFGARKTQFNLSRHIVWYIRKNIILESLNDLKVIILWNEKPNCMPDYQTINVHIMKETNNRKWTFECMKMTQKWTFIEYSAQTIKATASTLCQ